MKEPELHQRLENAPPPETKDAKVASTGGLEVLRNAVRGFCGLYGTRIHIQNAAMACISKDTGLDANDITRKVVESRIFGEAENRVVIAHD